MRRNNELDRAEEETHQMDRRKERVRQHLILIADLSALIVKELRMASDGMFKTDIIRRFPDYSVQQIEDAIESAIEDKYIELVEQEGNLLCYRAIQYDEDW
jgi:hypothetical protein